MSVYMLGILCIEIYKTINKLNSEFMNNIFNVKENKRLAREQYKFNLKKPEWNQVTVGTKFLKVHRPKFWNSLPFHIKSSENLNIFNFNEKLEWQFVVAVQFAQSKFFIRSIYVDISFVYS